MINLRADLTEELYRGTGMNDKEKAKKLELAYVELVEDLEAIYASHVEYSEYESDTVKATIMSIGLLIRHGSFVIKELELK